jgi:hypothetical protein
MTHALLIALQLLSSGADAYFTNRNAQVKGWYERDPVARIFVTNGTLERATYFAVYGGGMITGAELLDHYKHRHLALGVRAMQIGSNAYGAAFSAIH